MKVNEIIKMERKLAGLTQKALAEKAGYDNYQTILSMEKGERSIGIGDVSRIAKALNLNPEYFLSEVEHIEVPVLWRECKDKGECRLYENRLRKYLDDYADLKAFLDEPYDKFVPEPLSVIKRTYSEELKMDRKYQFAGKLASNFRKNYNLGDYPAGTLRQVIADLGILFFTFDMQSSGSAASLVNENGAAILLNKGNVPWRMNFDIAHELYHILTWNMHDYSEINNNLEEDDNEEHYANAFAGALLMPRSTISRDIAQLKDDKNAIDETFIIQGALKYMVSIEAILSRLQFLRYIDETKKEVLLQNCEKTTFWKHYIEKYGKEENEDKDEYPIEYFMLVMRAWREEKLSRMKFAHYLNKNIGEMDYYLSQKGVADGW